MYNVWYGTPDHIFPERRRKGKRRYPITWRADAYRRNRIFVSLRD